MRAVNLLPRDAQSGGKSIRNEDPAVVVGSVLGVVVIIVMSVGFLVAHSKVSAEQKKLSAAQVQLGALSLHKRPTVKVKTPKPTKPIIPVPAVTSEEQPLLDRDLRRDVDPDRLGPHPARVLARPAGRRHDLFADDDRADACDADAGPDHRGARVLARQRCATALAADADSRPERRDPRKQHRVGGHPGVQFNINATVKGAPAPAPTATAPTTPTDTTATTGASS